MREYKDKLPMHKYAKLIDMFFEAEVRRLCA
jgi:hypothetical protein